MPKDRADAGRIADLLREEKNKQGKNTIFSTVQSLDDFIPTRQEEKIAILKDARQTLNPKLLKFAKPKDRKVIEDSLRPEAFHAFNENDLPPLLLYKFRERDGSVGKIVLVDKRNIGGVDSTEAWHSL